MIVEQFFPKNFVPQSIFVTEGVILEHNPTHLKQGNTISTHDNC